MVVAWPANFPSPLRSYEQEGNDPVARNQMERGDVARLRFARPLFDVTYTFRFSPVLFVSFQQFYRDELAWGATWF